MEIITEEKILNFKYPDPKYEWIRKKEISKAMKIFKKELNELKKEDENYILALYLLEKFNNTFYFEKK